MPTQGSNSAQQTRDNRPKRLSRRMFLTSVGAGMVALAGCTAGEKAPPPRKTQIVDDIDVTGNTLVVNLQEDRWVMSRYDGAKSDGQNSLSFVGVANAKGKGGVGGRGAGGRATGGYSSAPRTGNGFAWFLAGAYVNDWYDAHKDDVKKYPVEITEVGIAYLGTTEEFKSDKPGIGKVPWDGKTDDVENFKAEIDKEGWYRLGFHVVGEKTDHNFRWECFDLRLKSDSNGGYKIKEKWKVSPRI